ncbi:c9b8a773-5de2-459c-bc87-4cb9654c492d [Sclerotinia trifoliorum]|uniref:C9b8a773-5de2-459c-bc87-4cb9654c492d n=1 Tax=Sclerotinia trifoliorum TaxID=28548 RepID=A0A8H2VQR4_9HELO|nr:c9b8a773-5de2-459c-bc87-4cb9654c492d [Sclerotinia trifoliorum]
MPPPPISTSTPIASTSISPKTITTEKFEGSPQFSDKSIGEAAKLFSENYGVWGLKARENMLGGEFGTHVKSPPKAPLSTPPPLTKQPTHTYSYSSPLLLFLHTHRNQGIAKRMLRVLKMSERDTEIEGKEEKVSKGGKQEAQIVGILSTHPFALIAVLSVFGNGIRDIDEDLNMMRKKDYVRELMKSCPVEYVRDAKIRGSLFAEGDEGTDLDGTVACANTQFWVDHKEPLDALGVLREKGIVWPFGELPDGCEFMVLVRSR